MSKFYRVNLEIQDLESIYGDDDFSNELLSDEKDFIEELKEYGIIFYASKIDSAGDLDNLYVTMLFKTDFNKDELERAILSVDSMLSTPDEFDIEEISESLVEYIIEKNINDKLYVAEEYKEYCNDEDETHNNYYYSLYYSDKKINSKKKIKKQLKKIKKKIKSIEDIQDQKNLMKKLKKAKKLLKKGKYDKAKKTLKKLKKEIRG